MSEERDVEKQVDKAYFVASLRRLADSIESGKSFRIQVANQRLNVPATATLGLAHEFSDSEHELEFELTWQGKDKNDADEDDDDD